MTRAFDGAKLTIALSFHRTPALHSNDYSPDDNRYDLRPFLYPPFYQSWSFKKIDEELARIEKSADNNKMRKRENERA